MSVASQQPFAHTMMRCTTSMFHCFFISQTAIVTVLVRNFCHGTSGHYWSGLQKKSIWGEASQRERERTDTGSRDREQRAETEIDKENYKEKERKRKNGGERGRDVCMFFFERGNKVLHLHGSGLDRCTTCEALLKACVH